MKVMKLICKQVSFYIGKEHFFPKTKLTFQMSGINNYWSMTELCKSYRYLSFF